MDMQGFYIDGQRGGTLIPLVDGSTPISPRWLSGLRSCTGFCDLADIVVFFGTVRTTHKAVGPNFAERNPGLHPRRLVKQHDVQALSPVWTDGNRRPSSPTPTSFARYSAIACVTM